MYLEIKDMKKSFGSGESYNQVLKGITTNIEQGQMCVIQGNSGSGKSTMLNCIGGLDTMDSGSVKVDGNEISGLNADELSEYRRANLGFIFQFYNLVPNLTVKENIEICQFLTSDPLDMEELLDTLGLTEHQDKFPAQLSGGQQQRCAIARAIINHPKLILADEPTGALDSHSSQMLLSTIQEMNEQMDATILMVTHDAFSASYANRILFLRDGEIYKEIMKGSSSRKEFFEQILEVLNTLGGGVNDVH